MIEYNVSEELKGKVEKQLNAWQSENVIGRIWKKDPTVWKTDPTQQAELSDRLGWLDLPNSMQSQIEMLENFADEIKKEFNHVVLLGMGGSSLAPEVFFRTYGSKEGYPTLSILDSTHPSSVKEVFDKYDLSKTCFIVASKSGGTIETMSFFYTFYDAVKKISDEPGKHFISITDPASGLEKLSKENNFRKIFSTPSEVGGRFSALTFFGLLPQALIGMDLTSFLNNAKEITDSCKPNVSVNENPGMYLGALIAELAKEGKDKLTFFASPSVSSFPVWVEQLIAESTGKEDIGILPVADEEFISVSNYNQDRVFVFLRLDGDNNSSIDKIKEELSLAGFPVIIVNMTNKYNLAKEFYRWEMATAIAGAAFKINPFDQPNVQLAKTMAMESLNAYKQTGKLPEDKEKLTEGSLSIFADETESTLKAFVSKFLGNIKSGDFIAINAFIPMNSITENLLQEIRTKLNKQYKAATVLGFGPRFLHSTGQFHKGGTNSGYFIEITSSIPEDFEVAGQGYSFGVLVTAQALGDLKALQNKQRRVIRINLNSSIEEGLKELLENLKA